MSNSVSDTYALAHDKFCPVYEGSCCPWMGNCVCQCNCDDIAAIRKDERAAALRDVCDAYEKSYGDFDFVIWKIENGTLGEKQ